RVRLQRLDLAAALRREGLAHVEQGVRIEHRAAAARGDDAEESADHEPGDHEPPTCLDPLPGGPQVDFALSVEIEILAHPAAPRARGKSPITLLMPRRP